MTSQGTAATLVAGRYRLERPVKSGQCTTLWRAVDEVLARPVAVKILDSPGAVPGCGSAAEAVLVYTSAATSAGRLAHPRIAATYDAGVDGELPYIVTEWVDGVPLGELVARSGVLEPDHAIAIGVQAAQALVHAHTCGSPHGDLDASNVLVCPDGGIKLTDFGVAAALCADPAPTGVHDAGAELRDTRALAALVYLCVTGRSVYGAEPDIPRAPRREGRILSPLQVRAGVPRSLDAVVMRTLDPAAIKGASISTPDELLTALAALEAGRTQPADPRAQPHDQRPVDQRPPRLLRAAVPVLVLTMVLVAVVAGLLALRKPADVLPSPSPASGTAAGSPTGAASLLRIRAATDFDPEGRPDSENSDQVPFAHDGDQATAWETVRYDSAALGQLKSGVGVRFDLGAQVTVREVRIAMLEPGAGLEIRVSDTAGPLATTYAQVARADNVGTAVTLTPRRGSAGRYWVVWVTRLPATPEGFKARIAEVAFYS